MEDVTSAFPIISNRYQITNTIATGGMAVVYRAKDLVLQRTVALKILRKDFSDNSIFQERFRSEARSSARLSHPNVVSVFDFGFDKNRLYIVMEFIQGKTVGDLLEESIYFPLPKAVDILEQTGRGLAHAHEKGIVHCDIKPQNLILTTENNLKITDFGIARALDTASPPNSQDVVWGSPYYISPEQADGKPPSPASDIYSLGIIGYQLLAGQLPFEGSDALELVRKHKIEYPMPLQQINPQLPSQIIALVNKSIQKNPLDRYQNADEFLLEIRSIDEIIVENPEVSLVESSVNIPTLDDEKQEEDFNQIIDQSPNLLTIFLSIIGLIFIGGLIPFWIFIYLSINR